MAERLWARQSLLFPIIGDFVQILWHRASSFRFWVGASGDGYDWRDHTAFYEGERPGVVDTPPHSRPRQRGKLCTALTAPLSELRAPTVGTVRGT
jgi:hypothetical protein